jgi:hypothetical protein
LPANAIANAAVPFSPLQALGVGRCTVDRFVLDQVKNHLTKGLVSKRCPDRRRGAAQSKRVWTAYLRPRAHRSGNVGRCTVLPRLSLWDEITTGLGIVGSGLGVWNFFANLRTRNIVGQAKPLSELREHLENVLPACEQLRMQLNFDRYDLVKGPVPAVPEPPESLTSAIQALPSLSWQILSPSESRIEAIVATLKNLEYYWKTLHKHLTENPENVEIVMDFRTSVDRFSATAVRLLSQYIGVTRRIIKRDLFARWRYGDHWRVTEKVFRVQ